MMPQFDSQHIVLTEFGIGRDDGANRTFFAIPVDAEVQNALQEMVQATQQAMQAADDGEEPALYEPSEKHAAIEHLYLPLNHEWAVSIRNLHHADTLHIDAAALNDSATVFCYFARMQDGNRNRLTALRRATQFKGVLKSKGRLVRMLDDSLKIVEDTIFKLDNDFDLLVDSENIHILRPSGFEFAGKLQQAILDAVPGNIESIRQEISFVDFDGIAAYAVKHPRAARYLASILSQGEVKNIDKSALLNLCNNTGVDVSEANGSISITGGHEMGFLEVLDRRRYKIDLVKEKPECFKAASRRKING